MNYLILCKVRDVFDLYCPGCGGTRAINELIKFNIIDSMRYNPMPVLLLIDVVLMLFSFYYENRETKIFHRKLRYKINLYLLFFLISYTILRNMLFKCFGIDILGDLS